MSESEFSYYWRVVLSGMIRFFNEGHIVWSRENFYGIHGDEFAKSDYVQNNLKRLERSGAIEFVGDDDIYLKITDYDKLIDFEAKERAVQ